MNRDIEANQVWQRQLEDMVATSQYPTEAFAFVIDSINAYWKTWNLYQSLLQEHFFDEFVHDYAIKRFGKTTARTELADRSIRSADDIRNVIKEMVQFGLIEDHDGELTRFLEQEFELDGTFERMKRPELFGNYSQWRVSTLFFITTIGAIAVAGVQRLGIRGGMATLFCAWVAGIGLYSLITGIRRPTKGWWLNVVGGMLLFAIAFYLLYSLVNLRK